MIGLTTALALFLRLTAPFEYFVAPAHDGNPRNTEADILLLKDGRLLLAWNDFYDPKASDWARARISAMLSRDRGKTWSAKYTLQENIGRMNVMEPDLLRLKSGKILFAFCRKNSEADCLPMIRISRDDARTFSDPKPLPIDPYPSYTGTNPDRAIQLKSGRILFPVWYSPDYRVTRHIFARVYYSDDEAATWRASETIVDIQDSRRGAEEPGVIELKDGRIMMWIRTDKGKIYRCYSADQARTWSQPEPMALDSPNAPQSIKRIPKTGDLLLIWNNSARLRCPISAAISKDEGQTWQNIRNLEEDPQHTYAYTSILFLSDRALLTYYVGPPAGVSDGWWSLKLKAVPLKWFY